MGRYALVAVLLCLVGCGAREASDSSGGTKGGGAGGSGGKAFGGHVLPDLELWGYLRNDPTGLATDAALGPLSFESIRQSTDKTHALIHVSGFT